MSDTRKILIALPEPAFCALCEMAEAAQASMGEFARAAIERTLAEPGWREAEVEKMKRAGFKR